jgi:hypothetical protein
MFVLFNVCASYSSQLFSDFIPYGVVFCTGSGGNVQSTFVSPSAFSGHSPNVRTVTTAQHRPALFTAEGMLSICKALCFKKQIACKLEVLNT